MRLFLQQRVTSNESVSHFARRKTPITKGYEVHGIIISILIVYGLALSIALAHKAPKSRTAAKPVSRGWGNRLHILIIGATGGTGRQLVRQGSELGHQVVGGVGDARAERGRLRARS